MNKKTAWLHEGLRIMQYNLQVRDTAGMDPELIARQTEDSASNAVVINVGGIYAWYRSKVPFHHVNEYLPEGRDLLKEMIDAFHRRNIKFIARFDFSLADDEAYMKHPEWFSRNPDMTPQIQGATRMGGWSQLLTTCAMNGYRREEVAVPILHEVLDNYDIDGIFLNAPTAQLCHCEKCQELHLKKYGRPIPETIAELEPDWLTSCTKDSINVIYRAIKEKTDDVPLILYYAPFTEVNKMWVSHRDSIYDRLATADYICCEAQNVISNGIQGLPFKEKPSLSMKAGYEPETRRRPFGIIHSCPGMDWRHVGMPRAEYLPWMAQIPASNGILWHSVTGYPSTITDKNVMESATLVNTMARAVEPYMIGADNYAKVLVCWDGSEYARHIGTLLMKNHIPFDMMPEYRFDGERMLSYPCLVMPKGFVKLISDEDLRKVEAYVEKGGRLLVEESDRASLTRLSKLCGIEAISSSSENLTAAYARFEDESLSEGIGCDMIAMRGKMAYVKPTTAKALLTLVPPFAPLTVVGKPPERASIPVKKTDIPVVAENSYGKGKVILLPLSYDELSLTYGMAQHFRLFGNLVERLGGAMVKTNAPSDVQMTEYIKDDDLMVHLVNEVGTRPLMENLTLGPIEVAVKLPEGKKPTKVFCAIGGGDLSYREADGFVSFVVPSLTIWEMVVVRME